MTAVKEGDTSPEALKARAIVDATVRAMPLKRIGQPEDVANLVSFLVSRNSDCESIRVEAFDVPSLLFVPVLI